jgi:peptide/nickel transport system substrate-binding protein
MSNGEPDPHRVADVTAQLTRRHLLGRGAALGVSLSAAGAFLAACGGGASPSAGGAGASAKPVRGGNLRVGVLSNGAIETIDPRASFNTQDSVRLQAIYDSLYFTDNDLQNVRMLAESEEVSADGRTWTIRIKDGITFHNGKPLTADDVVWTVGLWVDPKTSGASYSFAGRVIDPKSIKKVDARTVRIGLKEPNFRFPELLGIYGACGIVPHGADPAKSHVGTGPFKFQSFTPGKESVMVANKDYWQAGRPYVDQLTVNSSFTDEASRINALASGQVDVLPYLPFSDAKANLKGGRFEVTRGSGSAMYYFVMIAHQKPFSDVRVRQAMRLLADRDELVKVVFSGLGTPGNDVPGRECQFYDSSMKRAQDIEQAKSLLKQAGQQDLRVTLEVADVAPGQVTAAQVLAQQAKAAGVTIDVRKKVVDQYFGPLYKKVPFGQSYNQTVPSLQFYWATGLLDGYDGVYNETNWDSRKTDRLYREANATKDDAKAAQIWGELQKEQFDEGGMLLYGNEDILDAKSPKVGGITPSKMASCNNNLFTNVWLAS